MGVVHGCKDMTLIKQAIEGSTVTYGKVRRGASYQQLQFRNEPDIRCTSTWYTFCDHFDVNAFVLRWLLYEELTNATLHLG